jgi:hypothetical protein
MTAVMMGNSPLYVRVIGDAWTQIAEPIRRVHTSHSIIRASGRLRVEDGRPFLARMLARMLRLPRPTAAAETQLMVTVGPECEHWRRTFNGRHLKTRQYESNTSELAEQFGVLEFRFRLDASGGISSMCSGKRQYCSDRSACGYRGPGHLGWRRAKILRARHASKSPSALSSLASDN